MSAEKTRVSITRLTKNSSGKVVCEDDGEDRFVIQEDVAFTLCKNHEISANILKNFHDDFLANVAEWFSERADVLDAGYIPFDSDLHLFVVSKSRIYDFQLADELSELELDLASRGWNVSTVLLPSASSDQLSTFFDAEGALKIDANRPAA